ncbi:unnamed protein product, partial [Amoebophrya sp. A25]
IGLEVVEALTLVRSTPKAVSKNLREMRVGKFEGNNFHASAGRCQVTKEGQAVVNEAIAFCDAFNPSAAAAVLSHPLLALSAADHVADIGLLGLASHTGSDNACKPVMRMQRYGEWKHKVGECLWYGTQPVTGYQIVEDLIVDDGVKTRGHRLGVYDPMYHFVGVFVGFHKTFGYCCCI